MNECWQMKGKSIRLTDDAAVRRVGVKDRSWCQRM